MLAILTTILVGAIKSGTSVLYAIFGELITERAGIINLGTEGCMLCGALGGFIVTSKTGSPLLGLLAGGLCGVLLSLIHAFMVVTRKANQLASGLTLMFFGLGITAFLGQKYVNVHIHTFNAVKIPFLSDIPLIGSALFNQDIATYIVFIIGPLIWILLFKTRFGIMLRAAGEREDVAYVFGISPAVMKYEAVCIGGFLSGMGGAQLSIAYTMTWTQNITNGRGIIAVALVIFASWLPSRAVIGAYLFGGAQALSVIFQQKGFNISPFLLIMLPYIVTLIGLFIAERKNQSNMPEGLKKIFEGSGNN